MKVGLISLGCPKNLVDSEVMLGLARQAGHEITPDPADAQVLVVNTCAFIDAAKEESIHTVLEMARQKDTGACRRLVVTGCLAERYRDELRAQIPEIDAVLGTGEVEQIVAAIEGHERGTLLRVYRRDELASGAAFRPLPAARSPRPAGRRQDPVQVVASGFSRTSLPTYLYDATTPRVLTTPRHFAYVKVGEGCDYACAFCIIPTLRGRYRSRTARSVVDEARTLAARGVRELILVSQDTTFFGIDRGERDALGRLLRELNSVDGLRWIRLLYLYPTTISDAMLGAMAECEKVCKYVDLPLQHASTRVLRRMKRPGTATTYEKLLRRVRSRVPGVALRTTFIVGFPGETEEDFVELCGFVRDVGFDHVGVFTYSHEEGTAAHALSDDVPVAVKRRRRARLMAEQQRLVVKAQRRRRGHAVEVLVDGPASDHPLVLVGRLQGQAPEIDPVVYLTDCDPTAYAPGELIRARVVGARGYDLIARPEPVQGPVSLP